MSLGISPRVGYFTHKIQFEDEAGLCAGWFIHRSRYDTTTSTNGLTYDIDNEVQAVLAAMFAGAFGSIAWSVTRQDVTPASFSNH